MNCKNIYLIAKIQNTSPLNFFKKMFQPKFQTRNINNIIFIRTYITYNPNPNVNFQKFHTCRDKSCFKNKKTLKSTRKPQSFGDC